MPQKIKFMKKYLYHLITFILLAKLSYSQRNIIYGEVKDSLTNEALPGAIVYLEGTNISATTNFDG